MWGKKTDKPGHKTVVRGAVSKSGDLSVNPVDRLPFFT